MMFDVIYLLEMVGVVAFATSGMIAARAKNMDPVGVFSIAFITALGGGTLRDLILDNHPLYWIQHQEQPIMILIMALLFSYVRPLARIRERNIVLPDAIGLGIFAMLGAQLALNLGHSWFVASLLGVMTGTFGGLLRDTLCNEVPYIFRKDQIYASVAFAGCWLYFVMDWWTGNQTIAMATGMTFIVLVRMLAVKYDIRLQRDEEEGETDTIR